MKFVQNFDEFQNEMPRCQTITFPFPAPVYNLTLLKRSKFLPRQMSLLAQLAGNLLLVIGCNFKIWPIYHFWWRACEVTLLKAYSYQSQVAVTVTEGQAIAGCCKKLENFLSHNCLSQVAADSQCSVNQPLRFVHITAFSACICGGLRQRRDRKFSISLQKRNHLPPKIDIFAAVSCRFAAACGQSE